MSGYTGGPPLRLSVLDQAPIAEGSTGAEALHNTLDLARLADSLGYHRYWVAEHHGAPGLACTSPEALIGPIAAATARLRVGSGGIMLPHYSPLKVAETFSMLSALYPGRIDLGIGRAAGTDPATTVALQRDRRQRPPDDFREQLEELLGYFGDQPMTSERFARRVVLPGQPYHPEVSLLGSSEQSAVWAAELGLPYVFADFIFPAGAEYAAFYRQQFQPSRTLTTPQVSVAAWVICAETTAEATRLAASFRMMIALMMRGRRILVPPVEKALRFLAEDEAWSDGLTPGRRLLVGSPPEVRRLVEALAAEYGAGEVLLVNILYDHQARRRSYELLAEAFDLPARAPQEAQLGH